MDAVLARFLKWRMPWKSLLPFLNWLPELRQLSVLRSDTIAGITVAMVLIPQSMAYAHLAGLPVYMGLYASFIPPIIAALFGSSRVLSTGPVPVASLLTVVALQTIAAIGTPLYLQYVVLLTFLAGIIQLILSLLRVGVIVNFISYAVILGFINAVAIIIASLQLGNLFGVDAVTAPHYYETMQQVLADIVVNTHWPSFGMAVLTFVIILGGRRFLPKLPHTLIAVVVTTIIAWFINYEKLATIDVDQIINTPIRNMLIRFERYPQEMQKALEEASEAEKIMQETIGALGPTAEQAEEVINQANLAKLHLDRMISRHSMEQAILKRLRFERITQNGRVGYFVKDSMTPIGHVGPYQWRIESFPEAGKLMLQAGGEVVGRIPSGLPSFQPVSLTWDKLQALFMPALIIALVAFTEAITIAKRIATESRQRINTNQELFGQGLAKIIGSFFQSMPVSGGFTRSALNYQSGAKTGFSSIITGLVVMVVLLWLTPLFYYLPFATLAAVIMVGALGLFDVKEMWRIWKLNRREGMVVLMTFILTLALAPRIGQAVLLGMVLSLGVYLYESMRPRFKELTRTEDGELVEVGEKGTTETCYLISVIRFHGSLYFANAAYFEEHLLRLIADKQKLRYIILDCVSINKIDASGLEALRSVCARLEDAGMELWFTRVRPQVFDFLKRGGLYEQLGSHHFYRHHDMAMRKLEEYLGAKHMNTCPLARRQPQ